MRDVDRNYRVKLIARRDANISTLDDLAGKTMVFGSCDSADATVLPVYFLKKEGLSFDKVKVCSLHDEVDALGCPCHSEHHVLKALQEGRGAAGIISAVLWKRLCADQPDQAARFKEVWTSPPFSHCVFTARKDFDKGLGARFTNWPAGPRPAPRRATRRTCRRRLRSPRAGNWASRTWSWRCPSPSASRPAAPTCTAAS
jgi:ABC-type phosphate/phosphonate transport system substrate-binding protein